MTVEQRDIVFVDFFIPHQGTKSHPCIVISNNEIHETEDFFIAVMLSSVKDEDVFTLWLDNKMLTKPTEKKTQVRTHLFGVYRTADVNKKVSTIKVKPFDKVLDKIFETTLSTDDII